MGLKVLISHPLGAILSSTKNIEVERIWHYIVQRNLDDLGRDSSQFQPLSQYDSITAITVSTHHFGQH
jgi:hypothetical protein